MFQNVKANSGSLKRAYKRPSDVHWRLAPLLTDTQSFTMSENVHKTDTFHQGAEMIQYCFQLANHSTDLPEMI